MPRSMSPYAFKFMEIYSARFDGDVDEPADLVFAWRTLIELCDEGFLYKLIDFDYELNVRDQIEVMLYQDELDVFDEHKDFAGQVAVIDERLKEISREFPFVKRTEWWRRRILNFSACDYARDVMVKWNVQVKVVR